MTGGWGWGDGGVLGAVYLGLFKHAALHKPDTNHRPRPPLTPLAVYCYDVPLICIHPISGTRSKFNHITVNMKMLPSSVYIIQFAMINFNPITPIIATKKKKKEIQ